MQQSIPSLAATFALLATLGTSAPAGEPGGEPDAEVRRAWVRFTDPKAPEPEAREAALRLIGRRNPPEAAALLRIADDPRFSDLRRRRAVLLFFRFHVRAGQTLGRFFAELSGGREWLGQDQVHAIVALGGKTPVEMTPGSVFWIKLALPRNDSSTVYLRVEGRPSEAQFAAALRGKADAETADRKILQIGYSLSDPLDEQLLASDER